jgi:starch synthase (maltosyl-transferring)
MTAGTSRAGAGARNYEQIVIEAVRPRLDGGRHPVKAIVGETLVVEATVFRHGHDRLRAVVRWRAPHEAAPREIAMTLVNPGLDLWRAEVPLTSTGRQHFTVAAWTDVYASWVEELGKRVRAQQPDVASEIAEGTALVARVASTLEGESHERVSVLLRALRETAADPERAAAIASSDQAVALMASVGPRDDEARSDPEIAVMVDRARARVGAWYELFVRSQAAAPGTPGTFRDAERRLEDIRRMGFDVVYLAPVHPIGRTGRKGPNNTVLAADGDPGSPWAIGSADGGHDAVEPALGTIEDFDRFVGAAASLGMEIALDLAIQCSPDHPWVREHPDWFYRRPDGTIRYAENPPKKYEDIYPLNFDTADWRSLWDALREVVRFWIAHGVRIFRVDNPHTKPIGFWTWLIGSIQDEHPDVLFLAEAFTRPPMMQALARRGFTQSYTYFTWRNTRRELVDYLTELTHPDTSLGFRPNFFANTPDILPPILQQGGRPAFTSRLALAATLSPSYGIYSGYELCENAAIPGREEYLHSEKYEIKVRDWDAPGNIKAFIARVNRARRDNPALQQFTNLRFLDVDDEQVLAYVKTTPDKTNVMIVVVNLDPFAAHAATVTVPPDEIGVARGASYQVRDLLTEASYTWTERNYVRLDPATSDAVHLFRVEPDRAT